MMYDTNSIAKVLLFKQNCKESFMQAPDITSTGERRTLLMNVSLFSNYPFYDISVVMLAYWNVLFFHQSSSQHIISSPVTLNLFHDSHALPWKCFIYTVVLRLWMIRIFFFLCQLSNLDRLLEEFMFRHIALEISTTLGLILDCTIFI